MAFVAIYAEMSSLLNHFPIITAGYGLSTIGAIDIWSLSLPSDYCYDDYLIIFIPMVVTKAVTKVYSLFAHALSSQ